MELYWAKNWYFILIAKPYNEVSEAVVFQLPYTMHTLKFFAVMAEHWSSSLLKGDLIRLMAMRDLEKDEKKRSCKVTYGLKDKSHFLDTVLSLASDLWERRELGCWENKILFKHSFLSSEVVQEDSQIETTIRDEILMKAYPALSAIL